MMGYRYGMMGGFGIIIPVIFIGLVVYGLISLIRVSKQNGNHQSNPNVALDILKQRYANGEISEEEYLQKRRVLKD